MTLNVAQLVEKASRGTAQLVGHPVASVVSCTRGENGWRMVLEVLERKAIPDTSDILTAYVVHLDDAGNVVDFQRLRIRRRGEQVEEELR